jgi:phage-related protein
MPPPVKRKMGFALYLAQAGERHPEAKPLKGFGSAGVLEVVEDFRSDAYRAVYTVRLARAVYVLHCFKKKSVKGARTPRPDADLIRARLQAAEQMDREG